jgi:hypothetical protein
MHLDRHEARREHAQVGIEGRPLDKDRARALVDPLLALCKQTRPRHMRTV